MKQGDASSAQQAELLLTLKNGGFSSSSSTSSSSSVPVDIDEEPLSAVGLHRIGTDSPTKSKGVQLNRRGMPARVRKKNKMYYDDETLVTSPSKMKAGKKSTPRGTPKKLSLPRTESPRLSTPPLAVNIKMEPSVVAGIATPDKRIAQQNGVRLRNFLKLPQAHKWVIFEWFYSNIDRPLFEGDNDFEIVLREAFPQLQTRKLSRRQWSLIRRLMGKPRRCSQAFFLEEREALEKKRRVLRLLQQRKITDVSTFRDFPLPSLIPMQLVIGTKVTARIRRPENGLYTGVIDAADTSDNTYRITFDRLGIGTHSIPDYEVLSNEPEDLIPLSTFTHKYRPPRIHFTMMTPPRPIQPKTEPHGGTDSDPEGGSPVPSLTNDPVLSQTPGMMGRVGSGKVKLTMDDSMGQFPVRSLMQIVQLSKILCAKREKIDILRDLNSQAEKVRSYGQELSVDFQRKYAALVLELEKLNRELNQLLVVVQQFCQDIVPEEPGPTLLPSQIRERCHEEAAAIVDVTNHGGAGEPQVTNAGVLELITRLTSLMLQMKNLTEAEVSAFELTSLQETLSEIRASLHPTNRSAFQNKVEVHLAHIISSVSRMGTLKAFEMTDDHEVETGDARVKR